MLHRVNPAAEAELRAVMALQRRVLEYACRADLTVPFDPAQQNAHFGPLATWFREHARLHAPAAQLNAKVRADPALAAQVLAAYDNDVSFDVRADDATFVFQCRQLPGVVLPSLRALLNAFYDILCNDGGYSADVTGTEVLNRSGFVSHFMTANADLLVCPACDGSRSDSTDGVVHATCDHYFPKSHHPALSVHPRNLLPTCTSCNIDFKGERDACDHASVHEGFLPYGREAFGPLEVRLSRNANGDLTLDLLDGINTATARVNALDHVLRLRARWCGRTRVVVGSIANRVREQVALIRRLGGNEAPDFTDMKTGARQRRGSEPNLILSESYLAWVEADDAERDALLAMAQRPQ